MDYIISYQESNFKISEAAFLQISKVLKKEPSPKAKLHFSVVGGGCSGFQYKYNIVDEATEDDIVFFQDNITILIDKDSIENFLNNAKLDYVETLGSAAFEVKNPNSSAKCGCGNSFAAG